MNTNNDQLAVHGSRGKSAISLHETENSKAVSCKVPLSHQGLIQKLDGPAGPVGERQPPPMESDLESRPPAPPLFMDIESKRGVLVVTPKGPRLGERETPIIKTELVQVLARTKKRLRFIVFDCSELQLISSMGLGMFIEVRHTARKAGIKTVLFGLNNEMLNMLQKVKMKRLFRIVRREKKLSRMIAGFCGEDYPGFKSSAVGARSRSHRHAIDSDLIDRDNPCLPNRSRSSRGVDRHPGNS